MAAGEGNLEVEGEIPGENKGKKVAKHDSGAADLEKVTDFVEEAEISSQDISNAMKVVSDKRANETTTRLQKERELSKVKVSKEDVDLIVQEMEIARNLAERKLKEHRGDVVAALTELVKN